MKKTVKLLITLALLASVCLSLSSCIDLDDLKRRTAWKSENSEELVFQGTEYKRLPLGYCVSYKLMSEMGSFGTLLEHGQPILLSSFSGNMIEIFEKQEFIRVLEDGSLSYRSYDMIYASPKVVSELTENGERKTLPGFGVNYDRYGNMDYGENTSSYWSMDYESITDKELTKNIYNAVTGEGKPFENVLPKGDYINTFELVNHSDGDLIYDGTVYYLFTLNSELLIKVTVDGSATEYPISKELSEALTSYISESQVKLLPIV